MKFEVQHDSRSRAWSECPVSTWDEACEFAVVTRCVVREVDGGVVVREFHPAGMFP
jgi:hypothetical protein